MKNEMAKAYIKWRRTKSHMFSTKSWKRTYNLKKGQTRSANQRVFICFIFIDMRRVMHNIKQKIEGIHEYDFLIFNKTAWVIEHFGTSVAHMFSNYVFPQFPKTIIRKNWLGPPIFWYFLLFIRLTSASFGHNNFFKSLSYWNPAIMFLCISQDFVFVIKRISIWFVF